MILYSFIACRLSNPRNRHFRQALGRPGLDVRGGARFLERACDADAIKECNRLGIVVDLAHASHQTVLGALKVSAQPMIVSHTSFDQRTGKNPRMAKMMAPRLISKDHAQVVADARGVIGVWTKLSDSMGDCVAGIKALKVTTGHV